MNPFERAAGTMSRIVYTTFSSPVIIRRKGKKAASVDGIFDEAHKSVDVSSGVPVSTVHPQVEFREQLLPWEVRQGDLLEINGVLYDAVDVQPDGYGHVVIPLHRREAP